MTEERLNEIQQQFEATRQCQRLFNTGPEWRDLYAGEELLAEVRRLQALDRETSRQDWPGWDAARILSCPRWQNGDAATRELMLAEAIRAEVAQERAECAAICDRIQAEADECPPVNVYAAGCSYGARQAAEAIRARGQV